MTKSKTKRYIFYISIFLILISISILISILILSIPSIEYRKDEVIKDFDVFQFERTPCYGDCPVYKLKIYGNGVVEYSAINDKYVIETKKAKLNMADKLKIISELNNAKFTGFESNYNENTNCEITATDYPSVILKVQDGIKHKEIHHYLGCFKKGEGVYPNQLLQLENSLEHILNIKRWNELRYELRGFYIAN